MRTITNTPPGQSVHPAETQNASLIDLNNKLRDKLVATEIKAAKDIREANSAISQNLPEKNEENSENSGKNI